MARVRDLWFTKETVDGEVEKIPTKRHGTGKRWLAVWLIDGSEKTQAFTTYAPAVKYARKMEVDAERGEYHDPKAGREKFADIAKRWLSSRSVDPSTQERYERCYRKQVEPEFGKRAVRAIKPSEVQSFLVSLEAKGLGASTVAIARHVVRGTLELAVADGALKSNPARSKIISVAGSGTEKVIVWSDATIWRLIDAHPEPLRCLPLIGATCGQREGELFAIADEDVDLDAQMIYVRRQIKILGKTWVFARPKNDTERIVPLANLTTESIRVHQAKYGASEVTLPWEKPTGESRTYRLLFTHPDSGQHLRPKTLDHYWKPALVKADIIPPPVKTPKGPVYATTRREGRHALRHYYAALQLAEGTTITSLAELLGHRDPAFTLRVYGHLQPDSHDHARQAIDRRLFRPRAVSDGT